MGLRHIVLRSWFVWSARWFAAGCAAYLGEFAALAATSDLPVAREALLGLATGYVLWAGVLLAPALVLGAASGGLASYVDRTRAARRTEPQPPADPAQARRRAAAIYAASLAAALALGLSYRLSLAVVLEVVRPPNQAALLALLHVAVYGVVFALFAPLRALFVGALALLARRRVLALFERPVVAFALVALAALGLAGAGAYLARSTLSQVPWRSFVQPGAALAALLGALAVTGRTRALAGGATALTLVVLALPATFLLQPRDNAAVALFDRDLRLSGLASAALTDAFDRDGDGHRSFLGGGDCRPDDPRVHPGAADIPDDGRDQDCDGRDLKLPALLGGAAPPSHPPPEGVPARPDIVLITVDAFAAAHLKAFGYPHETTPNLEKLFARGVLFDRCFAQGPSTRLSFPSLFTSHYDPEIDSEIDARHPFPVLPTNTTLAEVLKGRGYRTAAVVASSYFAPSRWRGLTQGFDTIDTGPSRGGGDPPYNADRVTDAALPKLAKGRGDDALFLWVHYFDPHAPHAVPPGITPNGSIRETYDAELTFMDAQVGRLLAQIDAELGPDTLIVLTGDHGYGFDGKRYERGGYGYDLNTITLHVPTVFAASFLRPRRVSSLCTNLDLYPTLLDFARVPLARGLRGYSLVPELFEGRAARPQVLFHTQFLGERMRGGIDPLNLVSVRTPDYNYVLERSSGTTHLWKWSEDYAEKRELDGAGGADPAVRAELDALLSAFVYRETEAQRVHVHLKGSETPVPPRPPPRAP